MSIVEKYYNNKSHLDLFILALELEFSSSSLLLRLLQLLLSSSYYYLLLRSIEK